MRPLKIHYGYPQVGCSAKSSRTSAASTLKPADVTCEHYQREMRKGIQLALRIPTRTTTASHAIFKKLCTQ